MDTKKISELPVATQLTGDELVPVVQNGITSRATLDELNKAAGIEVELATTNPTKVMAGRITLPSTPIGGVVVWNIAIVYLDLTNADFDINGALKETRNYLVEDHLVKVAGDQVILNGAPDGAHAVVSYLRST